MKQIIIKNLFCLCLIIIINISQAQNIDVFHASVHYSPNSILIEKVDDSTFIVYTYSSTKGHGFQLIDKDFNTITSAIMPNEFEEVADIKVETKITKLTQVGKMPTISIISNLIVVDNRSDGAYIKKINIKDLFKTQNNSPAILKKPLISSYKVSNFRKIKKIIIQPCLTPNLSTYLKIYGIAQKQMDTEKYISDFTTIFEIDENTKTLNTFNIPYPTINNNLARIFIPPVEVFEDLAVSGDNVYTLSRMYNKNNNSLVVRKVDFNIMSEVEKKNYNTFILKPNQNHYIIAIQDNEKNLIKKDKIIVTAIEDLKDEKHIRSVIGFFDDSLNYQKHYYYKYPQETSIARLLPKYNTYDKNLYILRYCLFDENGLKSDTTFIDKLNINNPNNLTGESRLIYYEMQNFCILNSNSYIGMNYYGYFNKGMTENFNLVFNQNYCDQPATPIFQGLSTLNYITPVSLGHSSTNLNNPSFYYINNTIDTLSCSFSCQQTVSSKSYRIEEQNNNDGIIIYPNPTTDNINIISKETITNIEIFNATGQLVYTDKVYTNSMNIDVKNFVKGTYFVNVTMNGKMITNKVIIK